MGDNFKYSEWRKNENIKKYEKIGIMAGASTPQKSIDEITHLLNS